MLLRAPLLCVFVVLLFASLCCPCAAQQVAAMVKDLDRTPHKQLYSVGPISTEAADNRIFFVYETEDFGQELWSTDGTTTGTAMLKDIMLGQGSSNPNDLTEMGGKMYFSAVDHFHGEALWRSDGTSDGTVMIKDVRDGLGLNIVAASEDRLWFTNRPYTAGIYEDSVLWVSDGTEEGTIELNPLSGGTREAKDPRHFSIEGEVLYFSANRNEIWRTDGTEDGTFRIAVLPATNNSEVDSLEVTSTHWFAVLSSSANRYSLWCGDLSGNSNEMLMGDENQGVKYLSLLGKANGRIFVKASITGSANAVWTSDGSLVGTSPLVSESPNWGVAADEVFYFFAHQSDGRLRVLATDGTAMGTIVVKEFSPAGFNDSIVDAVPAGSGLYFSYFEVHGISGWHTDGTAAGTKAIKIPSIDGFHVLTARAFHQGTLFLSSSYGLSGGLWATEGTKKGTRLLTRPERSNHSGFPNGPERRSITAVGERVFFVGNSARQGEELWTSNGKPGGTRLIRDIYPGKRSAGIHGLTTLNEERAVFRAIDQSDKGQIWTTDGTRKGTIPLTRFNSECILMSSNENFVTHNGKAYFHLYGEEQWPLWETDGTVAGTKEIASPEGSDLNLWADFDTSVGLGEKFFLRGEDSAHGTELWCRENEVLRLVKDIRPGPESSFPRGMTSTNNWISFFVSNNTIASESLWRSDGTTDGTVEISRAVRGTDYNLAMGDLHLFLGYGSSIESPLGWWRSDGTTDGTFNLIESPAYTGPISTRFMTHVTIVDRTMFFVWDDGIHGFELWKTDGTKEGTAMVADLVPGTGNSYPDELVSFAGRVYFAASDPVNGRNLWSSDGTASGTVKLDFRMPRTTDLSPSLLTPTAEGRLFFKALSQGRGQELHILHSRER